LRGWKSLGFVTINGDLSHAYLGSNIISIPERLINIAILIPENSDKSQFIFHFTNYFDTAVLCHISKEFLTVLMDMLKLPCVYIL
jgi:hypothetical protein